MKHRESKGGEGEQFIRFKKAKALRGCALCARSFFIESFLFFDAKIQNVRPSSAENKRQHPASCSSYSHTLLYLEKLYFMTSVLEARFLAIFIDARRYGILA